MTSVKSVIHSFLNEPELVKTLDYIEAFLYLIFAFGMTAAYLFERTGWINAGVNSAAVAVLSILVFAVLFWLRRPINRNNGGEK